MVGLVVHMHGGLVLTKKSTVGAAIITTLCLLIRVHHSDNLLGDSVAAAEADFNFWAAPIKLKIPSPPTPSPPFYTDPSCSPTTGSPAPLN